MAQGGVSVVPTNGAAALTTEELHEILECEKIVRFRDAVIAGIHPKIKVPPALIGKFNNSTRNVSTPSIPNPRTNPPPPAQDNLRSTIPGLYTEESIPSYNTKASTPQRGASGRPPAALTGMAKTSKSEINPILLEKSDDLIKAEIQLQRQRLERNLREQVEQRRIALKAALQTSESLPDFDLSDVLSKALTIVHPTTAAEAEAEADQSVGARTSASDSFDENTFYSSQHDTPEKSSISQELREAGEVLQQGSAPADSHVVVSSPPNVYEEPRDGVSDIIFSNDAPPGLQELAARRALISPSQSSHPFPAAISDASTNTVQISQGHHVPENVDDIRNSKPSQFPEAVSITPERRTISHSYPPQEHTYDNKQMETRATLKRKVPDDEEPLVRSFALSPVAPQPARVSPLATARAPPVVDQTLIGDEASATAQVAAVRKPTSGSSPESSPKGSRSSEKRKGKKKKNGRKSLGDKPTTADTLDSPYIKPEPRSPSPFGVTPLPRPQKRQRQTQQQAQELNYDEPRYEVPRVEGQERVVHARHRSFRPRESYDARGAYDGLDDDLYDPRGPGPYQRVPREDPQYRRIVSHDTFGAPRSPGPYALPYSPNDPRPMRTASRMVVERPLREPPRYFEEPQLVPRATGRIEPERGSRSPIMHERRTPIAMAPPRLPPTRVVVDEHGRQYYTAAPASIRQSVAPSLRPSDEEYIYERPPVRIIPRHATDLFEEDGVVYGRPSPQLIPARRVITLPEHEMDARTYRQREYSVRPMAMAPPEEYVRVREPVERRQMSHFEEPPREYSVRLGSVRPERYEAPREARRLQSVRPEPFNQDQVSSIRPEHRLDMPSQMMREYSVRPGESELVRREIPLPEGGHAPSRPVTRRLIDEVEYVERPSQRAYADDVRREVVYR